jgi:hypothetical protein
MRKHIIGGMVRKDDKDAGSKDDHATRKHKGRKKGGRGMFGRKA